MTFGTATDTRTGEVGAPGGQITNNSRWRVIRFGLRQSVSPLFRILSDAGGTVRRRVGSVGGEHVSGGVFGGGDEPLTRHTQISRQATMPSNGRREDGNGHHHR